jgi:hypothetical protein
MKKIAMQKALISGAAAFGILGFASPAAFAWSGSNGNYTSGGYGSYGQSPDSNRCSNMSSDWDNGGDNRWNSMGYNNNNQQNDCKPMYLESSYYHSNPGNYQSVQSYGNGSNCGSNNSYGSQYNQYGASDASYGSSW